MKKRLQTLFVLGMVLLSVNVFSQAIEQPEPKATKGPSTHFGLLLNLVSTNLNYGDANHDLSDYKKSNIGLQAGVSFQGGITSRLSLLSEFYFLMKGGQLKANNSLTGTKTSLRFYSLELPVLARVHFGKFYLNAGPYVGYSLSGRQKIEGSSESISFENSDNGFNRFDAGLQFGGGYGFKLRKKSVLIDLRYVNGLTNLSNNQEMYTRYLNINVQLINPWKSNPFGRAKI
jgi:Outer membrane protein beta-barrel domain